MSRYLYYIDKDYKGVKSEDKHAIVDSLSVSKKTTAMLSKELGLESAYVRKAMSVLLDIGYVEKCGRYRGHFLWGLKG